MLFTEQELRIDKYADIDSLDFLTESEAVVAVNAIPVIENARLGSYMVDFASVESFSESHGCTFVDAISTIASANSIDESKVSVVVDEASLIETPEIASAFPSVVVRPISENSAAYQFADWAMSSFLESGEASYIEVFVEEGNAEGNGEGIFQKIKSKLEAMKNKVTESKPAQWISQKIAALKAWFSKKWESLKAKIKDNKVLNKIKDYVNQAIEWLKDKLTKAKNKVKGVFSSNKEQEA